MPTIKLTTELKDEKGNTLGSKLDCLVVDENNDFKKDDKGQLVVATIDKPELSQTLRSVIESSLLHENPRAPLSGEEKSKRYKLWLAVNKAKANLDISMEDAVIIKDCILDIQPILIAGQCQELIEGK